MLKRVLMVLLAAAALCIYTKAVWQSGYDAGADVNGCLIATFAKYGDLDHGADEDDPQCVRAGQYEHNPLWVLRRRNGG